MHCPVCGYDVSYLKTIYGPKIIYSEKIEVKELNFYICRECGLTINQDAEKINLYEVDYDNNENLQFNFKHVYIVKCPYLTMTT